MALLGRELESLGQASRDAKTQIAWEVDCGRLHGCLNSKVDQADYLRPALTAAKSAEAAVLAEGVETAMGGMAGRAIERRAK